MALAAGDELQPSLHTKEARFFILPRRSSTVTGRVVEVVAKPGKHLKAGDVMFRIEDETYKNTVAQTKRNPPMPSRPLSS